MDNFIRNLVIFTTIWCSHRGNCTRWSPAIIFSYFKATNTNSIDAVLCSVADNWEMFRSFAGERKTGNYLGLFRVASELSDTILSQNGRLGIFIDISCSNNRHLLTKKNDDWFANKFTWLIWDEEDVVHNVPLPISFVSDVYIMKANDIVRVYKVTNTMPSVEYKEAHWNSELEKLSIFHVNVIVNLNQSPIRGTILVCAPRKQVLIFRFTQDIYDKNRLIEQLQDYTFEPGQDLGNRLLFSYIRHIAQLFNFRTQLIISKSWGEKLENGSWVGMLGQLQDKTAEFVISPMGLHSERLEVSYPLIPPVPYTIVAVFRQPRSLGTYRALILELAPVVWLIYGSIAIVIAIVYGLIQKYTLGTSPDSWIVFGILQTVGVVANQGLSSVPQLVSSRILILSWLVVCLLISNYYSAGTVTALLSESPPTIKTLDELLKSGITLNPPDAPFTRNTKVLHRVFLKPVAKRIDHSKLYRLDEGVRCIENGTAFIGEFFFVFEGINRLLKSNTICELTVLNVGNKVGVGNLVGKTPYLREMFMRGILRSTEHGLMSNERRHWLTEKLLCIRKTEFVQVRLESVSVAFLIFVVGLFISVVVFCVEIYMRGGCCRLRSQRESDRFNQ